MRNHVVGWSYVGASFDSGIQAANKEAAGEIRQPTDASVKPAGARNGEWRKTGTGDKAVEGITSELLGAGGGKKFRPSAALRVKMAKNPTAVGVKNGNADT